jgi:hypothetical protein
MPKNRPRGGFSFSVHRKWRPRGARAYLSGRDIRVARALLVRQEKLAKSEGWKSRRGMTGNALSLGRFFRQVQAAWRRALGRRSRRGSFSWARFTQLLQVLALPQPHIVHPARVHARPNQDLT